MEEGGDCRPVRISRGPKMNGWMVGDEMGDETIKRQVICYVGDEAG